MDFILFLCQTINIHKPSQYGENTKFVKLLEAIHFKAFIPTLTHIHISYMYMH